MFNVWGFYFCVLFLWKLKIKKRENMFGCQTIDWNRENIYDDVCKT